MAETKIYAGTSGFAYREWLGVFYPTTLSADKMLPFYSARLSAVEINSTFYRMPTPRLMEKWRDQVPGGFRFALKAPRLITHQKQLTEVETKMARFVEASSLLEPHLGALLFQLPPMLPRNLAVLEAFIEMPTVIKAAFEFRHPSWLDPSVYRLLEKHGCALCISDREGFAEPPLVATADFGYLRLRRDRYESDDLETWLERVMSMGWKEVYVFFRHEQTGQGTSYAQAFMQ